MPANYRLTTTAPTASKTKPPVDSDWVQDQVTRATAAIVAVLILAVSVQAVVVVRLLERPPAPIYIPPVYELQSLPLSYEAETHPIRRVIVENDETQQSLNIIGVKLYNNSYMELYAEESIAIHVHVDEGVTVSFPVNADADASPFLVALMEFADNAETYQTYSSSLTGDAPSNRRNLALRIGRFYMCIFCKRGSWGCKGSVRKGKLRGSCTRLIAIGFDADK